MASASAPSPLDPGAGGPLEHFHRFPDLPTEVRIQIWQKAYRALPYNQVYRFRLKFSHSQETEGEKKEKPKAFIVPLKEVDYLTRELRSLRRVNSESRFEVDRSIGNGYLRFNQTERGDTTDICHPITLPWGGAGNLFCFVDLTQSDVICLQVADTSLIDHVFSTVQAIGLGLDRTIEAEIDDTDHFADFILLFPNLWHASLVSDLLMSEADLYNISDEIRSDYVLSSWSGWHEIVPEEVFGSDCENANIITKDEHLMVLEHFTDCMYYWGETDPDRTGALLRLSYGMMFRAKERLDYLLWSDEVLQDVVEEEGLLDEFLSDDFDEQSREDLCGEFNEENV